MNLFNIENSFRLMVERNWDTLYVLVDAHGTLIKPRHDTIEFYPDAIEVLKFFQRRPDFKTILWTSSHADEIVLIKLALGMQNFSFDFVNENPLERSSKHAWFEKKFYFNIILDDKAGFEPETDWTLIKQKLIELNQWDIMDTATHSKLKRAIYVGKTPIDIDGKVISYGTTGFYTEEFQMFYPDDKSLLSAHITSIEEQVYIPEL